MAQAVRALDYPWSAMTRLSVEGGAAGDHVHHRYRSSETHPTLTLALRGTITSNK